MGEAPGANEDLRRGGWGGGSEGDGTLKDCSIECGGRETLIDHPWSRTLALFYRPL